MKETKKPLWLKLIITHCIDKGMYGFTIPFLVGAEKESDRPSFTIAMLFDEIKASNTQIVISKCPELNELIIGTHKAEYPNINDLRKLDSLFVNSQELINFKTSSGLVKFLSEEYKSNIDLKHYSINYYSGVWGFFNENDIEIISNEQNK